MRDELDDLLGIDTNDPTQQLALELVEQDHNLLATLVAHRRKAGLSQSDVGRRMGVTQPAVAAFERSDADPKQSTIRRYALAVGVLVKHSVTELVHASSLISRATQATTDAQETATVHVRPGSAFVLDTAK
ncbi:helix-turn-helix domain-containing protein [Lentzea sp. E54]|uniref:helix-turn-helix domain-containing protein n=1 Tax=Lentzea xerophila TaxID=3435883 RepID=UPI003DA4F830